jgi:hypothetical protein
MPDEPTQPSGPPLSTAGELRAIWDDFRTGSTVACPTDGSPMALSVDGSGGVYRFVCTRCGTASAWFESGAAGLTLRAAPGRATTSEEG